MRARFAFYSLLPLAGVAWFLPAGLATAAPLDPQTCIRLREERLNLVMTGTRDSMARGPEWGRANLTPVQLKEIERLIELDEQIGFRCPDVVATSEASSVVPLPKRKPKGHAAAVPAPKRKPGAGR